MTTNEIKVLLESWVAGQVEIKFSSHSVLPIVQLKEYLSRVSDRPYNLRESVETFSFSVKQSKKALFELMLKAIDKNLFFEDIEVDNEWTDDSITLKPEWMRNQAEIFRTLIAKNMVDENNMGEIAFTMGTFYYELAINILHRFPSFKEFMIFLKDKGVKFPQYNESIAKKFYMFMRIQG